MNNPLAYIIRSGFVVAFIILTSGPSIAGSTSGTASTEIKRIIYVTETSPLQFGLILPDSAASTVTIATNGDITSTNANYSLQGMSSPAGFDIFGTANTAVSISFSNIQNLQRMSGEGSMALSNLTHNAGSSPAIGPDGSLILRVGGDLQVGLNQAVGDYSGGYTITINYQ